MPSYTPEVPDNIRGLQRQIDRLATAPLGPVSVGPTDGHIRFHTATGDTFYADATGAQVKHRGALTGLTGLTEGHTSMLEAHAGRLTIYGQEITGLGTRMGQAESDISAHGSRLTTYGQAITGLGTRMGSAESDISAHGTRLTSYGQAITGLGTRMGAVESGKASVSYADAIDSRARAAQARADAAYSLAASKASVSYVDTKASTDALYDLRRLVREWMAAARAQYPNMPPAIPA